MQISIARRRLASVAISVLLVVLFASCTVREVLTIDGDGAGEARLTVQLDPILISYYSDLMMAMTGATGEIPVFDPEQIRSAFAERPEVSLLDLENPDRGTLRVTVAFANIAEAFAAEGEPDVISFTRNGARRTLEIRLNRDAINRFLLFAPPESASMTEMLFPPPDGSVSRDEYHDELAWALEEYAPQDEVDRVLTGAMIEVTVEPTGTIVSQTGGVVRDGAVHFLIPVLELLTLSEERLYRVVYSP